MQTQQQPVPFCFYVSKRVLRFIDTSHSFCFQQIVPESGLKHCSLFHSPFKYQQRLVANMKADIDSELFGKISPNKQKESNSKPQRQCWLIPTNAEQHNRQKILLNHQVQLELTACTFDQTKIMVKVHTIPPVQWMVQRPQA